MATPFTVYVPNKETLEEMRQVAEQTAHLMEFESRNKFLLWLLTQPPDELTKVLKPLRAKDLQKQANKYRQ